ncbi:MAG: hypothetical protein Q9212_001044 [Teloschistes hypoglaucus]
MSTPRTPPFGYTFSESSDYPRESAPTPPSGPEILDGQERQYYDEFFQHVLSPLQGLTGQNLLANPFDAYKEAEGQKFLSAQPPRFHAAVTSLPPSDADHTSSPPQSAFKPGKYPTESAASTSNYVPTCIAPASIFHRNDQAHQYMSYVSDLDLGEPSTARDFASARSLLTSHNGSFSSARTLSTGDLPATSLNMSLNFSSKASCPTTHSPTSWDRQRSLQYGSDPQFSGDVFKAPPHQPKEENGTGGVVSQLIPYVESEESVESECEPSLRDNGLNAYLAPRSLDSKSSSSHVLENMSHGSHQLRASTAPSAQTQSQRGKARAQSSSTETRAANGELAQASFRGRRRRATTPKPKLSSEEKRKRHREAEQKRRDKANEPKEDMLALCPGLHEAKVTKSGELLWFHEWLRSLVEDNERMEKYLERLRA